MQSVRELFESLYQEVDEQKKLITSGADEKKVQVCSRAIENIARELGARNISRNRIDKALEGTNVVVHM